jgi:D-3-phosphoglycerate dehydrogenase / 2-oxoglutarate reductase
VSGQVLGLVGLGRIGAAVAERAAAFGMQVLAHTQSGLSRDPGVQMVSLEELLRTSDYVSLHAPLTATTRGMIGPSQLELMKPTAWIINTSRGPLIDTAALWNALQKKQIAGAALDVFSPEPPDLSEPLYCDERVIVTPHAAFVSQESLADLRRRAATQIAAALTGERPENVVNPQVLGG